MDWDALNAFNNTASRAVADRELLYDLMERLGSRRARGGKGGRKYRGTCPVHGGDGAENFDAQTDGHTLAFRWACHSHHCEKKGWRPTLVGLVRGVLSGGDTKKKKSCQAAVDYLRAFLGEVPAPSPPAPRPPEPSPALPAWDRERVRTRLVIPSPYFVGRGYDRGVLGRLDVGHSRKLRKSVVPFYDDEGERCVGHAERWESDPCGDCGLYHRPGVPCRYGSRAKWVLPKDFPKGRYLYNLANARRQAAPFVLLVEGCPDVFAAVYACYPAVASLGADLTPEQADKLAALGKRVLVAYDNDEAGRGGSARACGLLRARGVAVKECVVPDGLHDVGDCSGEQVARMVMAAGEDDDPDELPFSQFVPWPR